MLLDQFGRIIEDRFPLIPPREGRRLAPDVSDRLYDDVSRHLTPGKVDAILEAANGGDASDQAELSTLILEKNVDIAHAFGVRRKAVTGLKWHVDGEDKRVVEAVESALKNAGGRHLCSFADLIGDMTLSLIVGYTLHEIVWGPGGSLRGFSWIPPRDLDFMSSFEPKIKISAGENEPLTPCKYVYATPRMYGSDPVRGGLIRPLAWLHCFSQLNTKDMLSFTERYGMPVIIAKVSDESYEKERQELVRLIRSFGPNTGGVVTHGTEIQTVQAANNNGEIYFRVQEWCRDSIQRLLLGQTASSGDGGGLSKDNAQDKVRQDILEADAAFLSDVVNRQIVEPFVQFNFGAVERPVFTLDCIPPEDKAELANVAKTLHEAGVDMDLEELSEKLGYKLTQSAVPEAGPIGPVEPIGTDEAESAKTLNLKQKYDAMGVAIRAGLLTATPEIEAQTRAELGLPAMTDEVKKAWAATGGIRQPITLKTAEEAAVAEALDVDDKAADAKPIPMGAEAVKKKDDTPQSVMAWLGPAAEEIGKILDGSEEEADKALKNETYNFGDSGKFEDLFVKTGVAAAAQGIVDAASRLSKKVRSRK